MRGCGHYHTYFFAAFQAHKVLTGIVPSFVNNWLSVDLYNLLYAYVKDTYTDPAKLGADAFLSSSCTFTTKHGVLCILVNFN